MKNNKTIITALGALLILACGSAQAGLPQLTWKRFGLGAFASYGAYWLYSKYGKTFTHTKFDVKKEIALQLDAITHTWKTDTTSPEYQEIQESLKAGKDTLIARDFQTVKRELHWPSWSHKGDSEGIAVDKDHHYRKHVQLSEDGRNIAWSDIRETQHNIKRGVLWDEHTLSTKVTWQRIPENDIPDVDLGQQVYSVAYRVFLSARAAGSSLRAAGSSFLALF